MTPLYKPINITYQIMVTFWDTIILKLLDVFMVNAVKQEKSAYKAKMQYLLTLQVVVFVAQIII